MAVGRSHTTVRGWATDERWPLPKEGAAPLVGRRRGGDSDVWRGALPPNPADADALEALSAADSKETRETKLRLLRARAEKAESENAVMAQKLIEVSAVKAEWAAIGGVFRARLQNLPAEILAAALRHGLPNTACVPFTADVRAAIDSAMQALISEVSTHGDD